MHYICAGSHRGQKRALDPGKMVGLGVLERVREQGGGRGEETGSKRKDGGKGGGKKMEHNHVV